MAMDEYELQEVVKRLEQIRGRNTELVSLYIPPGYEMNKIVEFLTKEKSEAENIKSKATRKNVQAALDKLQRRLKEVGETPENGVALFCGNVSEREGRPDIELWEVVPPEPVQSRRYRCDKEFVLEPLRDLVVESAVYGLIVVDKSEAAVGYLKGNSLVVAQTLESNVPGKTTKGGQCLAADTKIPLPDGSIRAVAELDEQEKQVLSADFDANRVEAAAHNTVFTSEHGHVYTVKTRHPQRRLRATGNHRCFVFTGEGVEERFVEDLSAGDVLVGSRRLAVDGTEQPLDIDVPARLVLTEAGGERLRERRRELDMTQAAVAEAAGVTQTAVSKFEHGDRNPSFQTLQALQEALELEAGFADSYCDREPAFAVPDRITAGFARFLGYVQGDGAVDGNRLECYEQREAVADAYADLFRELFDLEPTIHFREDKHYYRLRLYSDALVTRLQERFPAVFGAGRAEMPAAVQRSPDPVVAAYLRGLYDAEGSVTADEVSISMTADGLLEEAMLALQRFGITASITTQTASIAHLAGPAEETEQTRLRISEGGSIDSFAEHIGFTAADKQEQLAALADGRGDRARSDTIPVDGRTVRRLAESVGMNTGDFPGVNPYFRDEKRISYCRFNDRVLPVFRGRLEELRRTGDDRAARCEEVVELLEELAAGDLLLLQVAAVERTALEERTAFYDIDVPQYRNFVADGVVVHNSQQRFERIRENMYDTFLNQVADAAKQEFLHKARDDELLGIIVGGPGFAKDDLVEKDYLHRTLEDHVLTRIGTNYSGEDGMHELMEKAEDVIQESRAIKEQRLVQEFLTNLKEENGLSTYGLEAVAEALQMGAVETVLLSADIDRVEVTYTCNGEEHVDYLPADEIDDLSCPDGGDPAVQERRDIVDVIKEKADQMDSAVHLISPDSKEGQRLKNLGGIAAILRYRIN